MDIVTPPGRGVMTGALLPPAERLDTAEWPEVAVEPGGDEAKVWLADPDDKVRHLWKPITQKDDRRQGEDWAELLVHAIALGLGVPTAPIRLARRHGTDGSLSRDVTPEGMEGHPGTLLLSEIVKGYDRRANDRRGHTLANVQQVLSDAGPPPGGGCDELTAFDVFAGYLILDALVAAQDRHSDNWSVAVHADGRRRLMASYDHASSLAFNRRDSWRQATLTRADGVAAFVRGGTAMRFEGGRHVTLVEWAGRALRAASPTAQDRWRSAVVALDLDPIDRFAATVEDVSGVTRTFVMHVLHENRRRLIHEL